jgi:2-polyprenyl-3-methyl-5-hydroxy-6-metoxy-1,4-benzoquinol methylase
VKCKECGLVYSSPRPTPEELLHSYEEVTDALYLEESERGRRVTFHKNLRPLDALVPKGTSRRLLDIGCYTGILLEVAEEAGWETWGVEPCLWAAEEAQRKGLRVEPKTLAEAGFPEGFFDAVTMWDVIEHLSDPLGELREVRRVVKEGGIVSIHTTDITSPFARLLGERWPWLLEMHIYYFSPQTLAAMLEEAGLQVLEARVQGRYVPMGYLASRLSPYTTALAKGSEAIVNRLGLQSLTVPLNFGDLFTAYARKV